MSALGGGSTDAWSCCCTWASSAGRPSSPMCSSAGAGAGFLPPLHPARAPPGDRRLGVGPASGVGSLGPVDHNRGGRRVGHAERLRSRTPRGRVRRLPSRQSLSRAGRRPRRARSPVRRRRLLGGVPRHLPGPRAGEAPRARLQSGRRVPDALLRQPPRGRGRADEGTLPGRARRRGLLRRGAARSEEARSAGRRRRRPCPRRRARPRAGSASRRGSVRAARVGEDHLGGGEPQGDRSTAAEELPGLRVLEKQRPS